MATYRYTTELYKGGKLIGRGDSNSLKKHIAYTFSMVRDRLTNEEFPTPYIDETIVAFTKALKKNTCSKKNYYNSFHNDNGIILKLIRVGLKNEND